MPAEVSHDKTSLKNRAHRRFVIVTPPANSSQLQPNPLVRSLARWAFGLLRQTAPPRKTGRVPSGLVRCGGKSGLFKMNGYVLTETGVLQSLSRQVAEENRWLCFAEGQFGNAM